MSACGSSSSVSAGPGGGKSDIDVILSSLRTVLAIGDVGSSSSSSVGAGARASGNARASAPSDTAETDGLKRARTATQEDVAKCYRRVLTFMQVNGGEWVYDALVFRGVLEASGRFMDQQLLRSTIGFQRRIRIDTMKSSKNGGRAKIGIEKSSAVESAQCKLEMQLFHELALLRDSGGFWQYLIPDELNTRKRCALAHQLMVGLECWTEVMHCDHHLKYLTRRYLAMLYAHQAKLLVDDPECIFDA